MRKNFTLFLLLYFAFSVFFFTKNVFSQINFGGTPYSFGSEWQQRFEAQNKLVPHYIPTPDMAKIKEEDSKRTNNRFAYPIYMSHNLQNGGQWTEIGEGHRIWRLTIQTENAWCLRPIFDKFYLPKGAKLFIYNQDQSEVLGAFTQESYVGKGRFATDIIEGNTITIELFEPAHARNQSELQLWRVGYGYRKTGFAKNGLKSGNNNGILGFGSSGSCNVNVNCALGNNWQDQKRGIVKIVLDNINGTDHCSGSLINTANNSNTPYILSAKHCEENRGSTFIDTWVFIFNYEASTCSNPALQPSRGQSMSGATIVAMGDESVSDFLLLKLNQNIPESYLPYFNGWDKSGTNPTNATCIHHPAGDIKKISVDNNAITTESYYNDLPNDNTHFRVVWDNNTTTESGSSGSPLFDQNKRIVGQLHGGEAACSALDKPDWFGKFSISWNGGATADTRLRDWLDPTNLNPITVNGVNFVPNALENVFAQSTSIFPNPTTDKFLIKIENSQSFEQFIEIYITNAEGKNVLGLAENFSQFFESNNFTNNTNNNTINNTNIWQKEISLKGLQKGVYFAHIKTEKTAFTKKIVFLGE